MKCSCVWHSWQWTCGADVCMAVVVKENVYLNISIVYFSTNTKQWKSKWDCNCFPTGCPHSISLLCFNMLWMLGCLSTGLKEMNQHDLKTKLNSVALVRERTTPTEPTWPTSSKCTSEIMHCFTFGYISNTDNTQKTHDLHYLAEKLHCSNDMLHCTYVKTGYC